MTSLLVVEDHSVMVKALVRALNTLGKLDVRAVASSAEQALDMLEHLDVDLVLVDVSLPGKNGIQLVQEIHAKYPSLPCMMMSGHAASHYVQRSLQAGARGYVLKENLEGMLNGIQKVLAGESFISPELREEKAIDPGPGEDPTDTGAVSP